jgi:hypothetical protein
VGLPLSLGLPPSGSEQEAPAEEIEARSATHLALQHLQAIDVPLDRAGPPRQGHPGFDRRRVALEPFCYALQRGQCARCRLRQPRIERLRLPGTEELRKAVSEPDRLREGNMRVGQAGEQGLRFLGHGLGLAQRQPGRLAWR